MRPLPLAPVHLVVTGKDGSKYERRLLSDQSPSGAGCEGCAFNSSTGACMRDDMLVKGASCLPDMRLTIFVEISPPSPQLSLFD